MHGRKRFMGIAVTIVLLAGAFPFRAARSGEPKPMAPEMVKAIRDGDVPTVRGLIEAGADVNARDAEGNTPLILASFYAGPQTVALLLEKGADVNLANRAGVTALVRAATDFEKARLLLDAGAKVSVRTAEFDNTPLILAARRAGNARTVKLLLARGADANEHNSAGVSPVLAGAASGDMETVQLLLDAGANADDFPKAKELFAAVKAGLRTPMMWAAYYNDARMVRLLLNHGADPNRSTYFGTPLTQACWNDGFEAAELLIDSGADVNFRDAVAGFTPLHWAAGNESRRPHLVKLLLGCGADPNATGGESVGALGMEPQTPRRIAEKRGRTPIVAALAAAGAKEPPPVERVVTPHHTLPGRLDDSAVIASAEQALATLQATATRSREAFLRHTSKQNCVSCHQQYLPMAAVGHARNRSIHFDEDAAREQVELLITIKDPFAAREGMAQTLFSPDPAHIIGYELLGLAAERVSPGPKTDGRIHHLVTVQASDGRWTNNIPRPPMMSSDVTATALSIHAVKNYGWKGRAEEFADSVERARQWLWKVKPETNEETAFQLLGLHWAGEQVEKLNYLAGLLRAEQRRDGGWAQLPTLESDAYATGQALFALAPFTKDPATDLTWQRGLRFLLETQGDDGTWHVVRRAFPFQPTMSSGFPHHRDSWISAAGTSWAVLAMTQATPVGYVSGKPAVAPPTSPVRTPKDEPRVDFARQIKPLLERSCAGCHSGDKPRGLFRVDGREAVLKGGASGEAAVVPGHSEKSPLIDYVSGNVPDEEMPPKAQRKKFPALAADDVALLRAWIDQGAEWPKDVSLSSRRSEKAR